MNECDTKNEAPAPICAMTAVGCTRWHLFTKASNLSQRKLNGGGVYTNQSNLHHCIIYFRRDLISIL